MIYTNTRPWGSTPGASTFGNNYVSVDADGNIVNSNFVNGIDFFNLIEGGCTNDNFYISPANGRCVYDFNATARSEEHTSELQSLMRISYAVFCLKKKQK